MTKSKPNCRSTKRKTTVKNTSHYNDKFLNMHTFKMQPVSAEWLELLAKELINWALNDEDALTLTSFYVRKGICSLVVTRWIKQNETFAAAHQFAKEAIGDRREIGALTRKLDPGIVIRSMPMYDNDWKELEEWRASLKNKEQEQKVTTFNISIPSFATDAAEKKKQSTQIEFAPANQPGDDLDLGAN